MLPASTDVFFRPQLSATSSSTTNVDTRSRAKSRSRGSSQLSSRQVSCSNSASDATFKVPMGDFQKNPTIQRATVTTPSTTGKTCRSRLDGSNYNLIDTSKWAPPARRVQWDVGSMQPEVERVLSDIEDLTAVVRSTYRLGPRRTHSCTSSSSYARKTTSLTTSVGNSAKDWAPLHLSAPTPSDAPSCRSTPLDVAVESTSKPERVPSQHSLRDFDIKYPNSASNQLRSRVNQRLLELLPARFNATATSSDTSNSSYRIPVPNKPLSSILTSKAFLSAYRKNILSESGSEKSTTSDSKGKRKIAQKDAKKTICLAEETDHLGRPLSDPLAVTPYPGRTSARTRERARLLLRKMAASKVRLPATEHVEPNGRCKALQKFSKRVDTPDTEQSTCSRVSDDHTVTKKKSRDVRCPTCTTCEVCADACKTSRLQRAALMHVNVTESEVSAFKKGMSSLRQQMQLQEKSRHTVPSPLENYDQTQSNSDNSDRAHSVRADLPPFPQA